MEQEKNFIYVNQDNYLIAEKDNLAGKTLYCDSATSCITIIVTGKNHNDKELVAISHLSREGRFKAFFEEINSSFSGEVSVYAAGANPPNTNTKCNPCLDNAIQVSKWIFDLKTSKYENIQLIQATMRFGEGNPAIYNNNLDCLGIDLSTM